MKYNFLPKLIWLCMNVVTGLVIFYALKGQVKNINVLSFIVISCALLVYTHPLPLLLVTWKYPLPKQTVIKYILKFGLPYDVGKDTVTWNNMAGFNKTWVMDERVSHSHPMEHIDFVYSTLKIPGIKPEHVCIIAQATGSIFIDMLKEEATARCHYLVKNAVSLGFVQDVVAGKISMEDSREEYGRRILNNIYPPWFHDPLEESHTSLGEGAHHILGAGQEHIH